MKYIIIVGLLAVALWWVAGKRRQPPAGLPAIAPPVPGRSQAAAFRHWLAVLYRDRPQDLEAAYQAVAAALAAEGLAESWTPESIIQFDIGGLLDEQRLFLVDWKDGESFIDFADGMAARFGFEAVWTAQNQEEDLPEALMQAACVQFLVHGAVLYNTETGGDYYCLAVVPQADAADFEAAAQQWGLGVRTAAQPY